VLVKAIRPLNFEAGEVSSGSGETRRAETEEGQIKAANAAQANSIVSEGNQSGKNFEMKRGITSPGKVSLLSGCYFNKRGVFKCPRTTIIEALTSLDVIVYHVLPDYKT
jgi:hypothetical protein